jgi:hypothetical protein
MNTLMRVLLLSPLLGAAGTLQDRPEAYVKLSWQLRYAFDAGDYERAEEILRAVQDVNLLGTGGGPMLTSVSGGRFKGKTEPMRLLLRYGADPNYGGRNGESRPLVFSVGGGTMEQVRILVEAGADPNLPGNPGWTSLPGTTALGASIERERADGWEKMIYLLSVGARVDLPSRGGALPLQIAAYLGKPTFVAALLDHGADIEQRKTETLATALHAAVLENKPGNAAVVRLLLDRGAKTNVRDSLGRTPYDIAKQKNFTQLLALLPPDPPE